MYDNILEENTASIFRAKLRRFRKWTIYLGLGKGLHGPNPEDQDL
jgi:hypothetical protein